MNINYQEMLNVIDEGVCLFDVIFDEQGQPVDALCVYENGTAVKIFGQMMTGKRIAEVNPDMEPYWLELYGDVARTGVSRLEEFYAAKFQRWYDCHVFSEGKRGGNRIGIVFKDTTDNKHKEDLLRLSTEKNLLALEIFKAMVHDYDVLTDEFICLDGLKKVTGYDLPPEPTTAWWEKLVHPDDLPACRAAFAESLLKRCEFKIQYRVRHRNGGYIDVESFKRPFFGDNGQVIRVLGIIVDITSYKRLERELSRKRDHLERVVEEKIAEVRRNERQYCTLVDSLPVVISRYDKNLRYLYRGPQGDDYFESLDGKQLMGKSLGEIGIPAESYRAWEEKLEEVLSTGQAQEVQHHCPHKNGGAKDYLIRIVPELNDAGQVESLLTVSTDITELNKAHEALRRSEERFRKVFQNSPDIIHIMKMNDDTYFEINQAFVDIFGYRREEVIGRTPADLNLVPSANSNISDLYSDFNKQGALRNIEVNFRAKSGKIITALCSSEMINISGEDYRLTIIKDITKERMLETKMARLDRLKMVGEMAAAIGHEVRNPLTTVRGYLQFFQGKEKYAEHYEQFSLMIEELDRANDIISGFLSLARNKAIEMKRRNLSEVISLLLPLLNSDALLFGHYLQTELGEVSEINLDEKEIRQLVLNLVRNGFEAMQSGGVLTIRTSVERDKVVLEVSDTGSGISQKVMDKLSIPFTTTKENGTGLGLAVCYQIAERHNAKIEFSTCKEGTTFYVKFSVG